MKEMKYWDNRYKSGGKSRRFRIINTGVSWVWSIINRYAKNDVKKSCIDVGCGDLTFWRYFFFFLRRCDNYIGIDVSSVIIERNKRKYNDKIFYCRPASEHIPNLKSDVVLCNDVLFHIFDEQEYIGILSNLCRYSTKWIILSNWWREPDYEYNKDYQKYRDFSKYMYIFKEYGFILYSMHNIPSNNIGAIYIFKKVIKNEN